MNNTEIKNAITDYMTKNVGSVPNYKTVGGYKESKPVFDQMIADGEMVEVKRPSKSGKRMMTTYVMKEFA